MATRWIIVLMLVLLAGCDSKTARMEHPEDPQGRYHDQIAAAKRALEQNENWADRAEWEVLKSEDGWEVIAWRVEHPDGKGAERYLPWGCSIIQLDHRMIAIHYRRKG